MYAPSHQRLISGPGVIAACWLLQFVLYVLESSDNPQRLPDWVDVGTHVRRQSIFG